MCFHVKTSSEATKLEKRFKANFKQKTEYSGGILSGFTYPQLPIILNSNNLEIVFGSWGLVPIWAKDNHIRQYTLNAKIETLHEKPSFKSHINNRCIIPLESFFEWKWLDTKGKNKQKYEISLENGEIMATAGLYSHWASPTTAEVITTFTIITCPANSIMEQIHNTKKRMPMILLPEEEEIWLNSTESIALNREHIKLKTNEI